MHLEKTRTNFTLAHISMNMVKQINRASLNVARSNKVYSDHLLLRMTVISQLECWTSIVRVTSISSEQQTALAAKEFHRYKVNTAALSKTHLVSYSSQMDGGYTFFWSRKGKKGETLNYLAG